MQRVPLLSVFIAFALTFGAAGCGSSPTGPSSGGQGATLKGQFRQGGNVATAQIAAGSHASRASSSQAEPVTVVVLEPGDPVRNEIARVPVVDGAFTIRGLPEIFFLRFLDAAGNRIGVDIRFRGVKPNQEVDIVVAMRNGEVVVLEERRTGIDHQGSSGIEIEGTANVTSIENDGVSGTLEVDRYQIVTQKGQTSIRKGNRNLTLEDIQGKQVHVRGVFQTDGTVFAHEIKLQEDEEVEDLNEEEKVTICHVPPGNPDNAKTKTVGASAVPAHLAHGDSLGPC